MAFKFDSSRYQPNDMVTPDQVQEAFGMSRWTYRRWIEDGTLPEPDIQINRQCKWHRWSNIVNAMCKTLRNDDGCMSVQYSFIIFIVAIFSFIIKNILL